MAQVEHFYVGDYGQTIDITVEEDGSADDISSATTKEATFVKENGATVVKTLSFITDGTDGQLRYTIEDGFLDVAGTYEFQVYLGFASSQFRTTVGQVYVAEVLG